MLGGIYVLGAASLWNIRINMIEYSSTYDGNLQWLACILALTPQVDT